MLDTGFSEITKKRIEYDGNTPWYLEVAITGACNFHCQYCNRFSADLDIEKLVSFLNIVPPLHHIQITGGEPTIHSQFPQIVKILRSYTTVLGLSTNGSAPIDIYLKNPVDMYSISLDDYDYNNLLKRGYVNPTHIINTITTLAKIAYVNIGLVIDSLNVSRIEEIIRYILTLGVKDIKLSVNSHELDILPKFTETYDAFPILSYRVKNFMKGRAMRGFPTKKCYIMQNDLTIVGDRHFPCLVYFREHGEAIGDVGSNMLKERQVWSEAHDCTKDTICSKFCMDFKCDFNREKENYLRRS